VKNISNASSRFTDSLFHQFFYKHLGFTLKCGLPEWKTLSSFHFFRNSLPQIKTL
jgi:hypothetical protein